MEYPFRYRFASFHPSACKGDSPKFVLPPFSEVPHKTGPMRQGLLCNVLEIGSASYISLGTHDIRMTHSYLTRCPTEMLTNPMCKFL
jgi:hypothetical protein